MKGKFTNLVGLKFNKLKVLELQKDKHRGVSRILYRCICDCGRERMCLPYNLKNNIVTGCVFCSNIAGGMSRRDSKEYSLYSRWRNIKRRCYDKTIKSYKDYGGRGISISKEWLNFKNFYNDMIKGFDKNLSLNRIDNNGDYSKENCRWVTQKIQNKNQRTNILVKYNDNIYVLKDFAKIINEKYSTVYSRFKRNKQLSKNHPYEVVSSQ